MIDDNHPLPSATIKAQINSHTAAAKSIKQCSTPIFKLWYYMFQYDAADNGASKDKYTAQHIRSMEMVLLGYDAAVSLSRRIAAAPLYAIPAKEKYKVNRNTATIDALALSVIQDCVNDNANLKTRWLNNQHIIRPLLQRFKDARGD